MYKYYVIVTEKGPIYVVKEFEKINGQLFQKRMFEFFTQKPCEEYLNYIMFNNGEKYLRYGDLAVDNEDLSTINTQITEISLFQLRCIITSYLQEGINPAEQTKAYIESGLSREQVDNILRKTYESLHKNNEIKQTKERKLTRKRKDDEVDTSKYNEKDERRLKTFINVFGDLFEDLTI